MYTIQENVRIVISLLKQYNVRHIVINPGGTNIPVTQAIQEDPFFKCYSVADERSAMYFAIGLHLQTGEVIGEMKVVNVDVVENEMVELDVVQIELN